MRFLPVEIGMTIPYFFVGLLIGYIAVARGPFFAMVPALLIRSGQMLFYFDTPIYRQSVTVNPIFPLSIVIFAVLSSLMGGLTGVFLKKVKRAPK